MEKHTERAHSFRGPGKRFLWCKPSRAVDPIRWGVRFVCSLNVDRAKPHCHFVLCFAGRWVFGLIYWKGKRNVRQ